MNKIYRLLWKKSLGAWVVVSEIARGRGRPVSLICRQGAIAAVLILLIRPGLALAGPPSPNQLPTGGHIVAGSGDISQSGAAMTVTQNTGSMIANWQGFDIGSQASVTFVQPSSSSIALNRVLSQNPTQIMGHLNANGQVMLVNPAGILFGQSSQVNVGGITASSLDIADKDFLSGNYRFTGENAAGSIDNQGQIATTAGGVVALIAPVVTNEGRIDTPRGSTLLAAGNQVSVDFTGDGLISYQVDAGTANALVENAGTISANGGLAVMTAKAADALSQAVVNNTGLVQAQTLARRQGHILLLADMNSGETLVGGMLDASAPNGGDGGNIETSGNRVKVANDARITTRAPQGASGEWLIDPADFTIAPRAGGTFTSNTPSGDVSGATLSNALNSGNVTIESSQGSTASGSGDINVEDTVSWSNHTLTLTAAHNINVDAVMTATSNASLALNPATSNGADAAVPGGTVNFALGSNGFTGRVDFSGTGSLSISGTVYTVIDTLGAPGSTTGTDLQGISANLSGHYVLGANINASTTSNWSTNTGFSPIGPDSSNGFTGVFDGLGHTITGLFINRLTNDVGLFGVLSGGTVRNVGLVGGSVAGGAAVGGLVGLNSNKATIADSYASDTVNGTSNVGGLAGSNSGSTIIDAYATGKVTGSQYVGGLVGSNNGSTITDAYATGNVTGGTNVGGLVGYNTNSTITDVYASGTVGGSNTVGGLVGVNNNAITDAYATGGVSGGANIGGLVGSNNGTITDSYATGSVNGGSNAGGLVGASGGTVSNSFYDANTTGQSDTGKGTPTATSNMMAAATFTNAGWSLRATGPGSGETWRIYPGNTYPLLTTFLTPVTLTANPSKTYDGLAYSGTIAYTSPAGTDTSKISGTLTGGAAVNAGTYPLSGLYSNQQGYDITINGSLTIQPRTITLSASKTYDGTASLTGDVTIGNLVGSETLSYSNATANSAHVATSNNYISAITLLDGSGLASNYQLPSLNATNAPVTINARTLTPTLLNTGVTKVYDGGTSAPSGFTPQWSFSGLASGDTSATLGGGNATYDSKDVASASKVTISGLSILGITGSNKSMPSDYVLGSTSASVTAMISKATLMASGSQAYNGSSNFAGASLTVTGVNGETFTASGNGTLASSYVQTNQQLASVSGLSLSGNNGALLANYAAFATSDTSVNVTPVAITVSNNTGLTVNQSSSATAFTGSELQIGVLGEATSSLTYILGTLPAKGTLSVNGTALAAGGTFTQADIDNGLVTYQPASGQSGSDSFTFTASDQAGNTPLGAQTVSLSINAIPQQTSVSVPPVNAVTTTVQPVVEPTLPPPPSTPPTVVLPSPESIHQSTPTSLGMSPVTSLVVNQPTPDQTVQPGQPVDFAIPANTFETVTGARATGLTFSASLANGGPLPSWLHFNPQTGVFSGTVPAGTTINLQIRVNAADSAGHTASTSVTFTTQSSSGSSGP